MNSSLPTPACKRSPCPVACSLDIFGDKWTLLIIRNLLMGLSTYGEFAAAPESIPTNILAERLKKLQTHGIISKVPYQQKPLRYEYALTQKGVDLKPVLLSMVTWANQHLSGTYTLEQIEAFIRENKKQKKRPIGK